jgi:hypothetical protein
VQEGKGKEKKRKIEREKETEKIIDIVRIGLTFIHSVLSSFSSPVRRKRSHYIQLDAASLPISYLLLLLQRKQQQTRPESSEKKENRKKRSKQQAWNSYRDFFIIPVKTYVYRSIS